MKRGFALLEVLAVIGVIGIIGMFSLPLLQQTLFRSDLSLAKSQVLQGLQTARQFASAAKDDSVWSFYIPAGIVFSGTDYVGTMSSPGKAAKVVRFTMPDTVSYSGLDMVTYGRDGKSQTQGYITLSVLNVSVFIAVTPANATTVTSISSSSSSSAGPPTGGVCGFATIDNAANTITTNAGHATITNLGALRTTRDGVYVPVENCFATSSNGSYIHSFTANTACRMPFDPQLSVDPNGGETQTVSVSNGNPFNVKVNAYYRTSGLLNISDSYTNVSTPGRFRFLRNGDSSVVVAGSTALQSLLQSKGLLDGSNNVSIGDCDVIVAAETGNIDSSIDFIDSVQKLSFAP